MPSSMDTTTTPLFEHHKIIVDPKQTPYRVDKFLLERLPGVTRNRVQIGIRAGAVHINGKQIKPSYQVKPHDVIQVMLPTPPRLTDILPENIPLDIPYEDDHLLIVNKPAHMVVHPGYANWTGTLVNALVYHFQNLPTTTGNEGRPGLVHRIDKGTSGLLVVGKTEVALSRLGQQFFDHSIQRKYYALVWGAPPEKGTIDMPIGRSLADRRVMTTYPEGMGGKRSITHYQVVERLGYVTLIECRLETGRTHQIRTHMQYIGHPLVGDTRYGGDRILKGPIFSKYKTFVQRNFTLLPHQALHAQSLGFIHPHTKEAMYFEAPPPTNFQQVLERWRRYTHR